MPNYEITIGKKYSRISFTAMAGLCEVLVRTTDANHSEKTAQLAFKETKRIENKFSRYQADNLVAKMNQSNGLPVSIDEETYNLLNYANHLFQLSDGLFDITSGVLRKIWQFVEGSEPPQPAQIDSLLSQIGFDKIEYSDKKFIMPKAMQIDFGGIAKEFAVDQVANVIKQQNKVHPMSFLVNFGGDLAAVQANRNDPAWVVGLESANAADGVNSAKVVNAADTPQSIIEISQGGMATSGNTKRYFDFKGKRYGHLLNPKTGYPVDGAPRSITTFANNCVLAGSFSSLAMLQGEQAEEFLKAQSVKYLCIW